MRKRLTSRLWTAATQIWFSLLLICTSPVVSYPTPPQPGSAGILPALPVCFEQRKQAGCLRSQPSAHCVCGIASLPLFGMKHSQSETDDWVRWYCGVQTERIQLNEDTIWAGEKRDRLNPEAATNLAEVRRLLFAGKPKEAEILAEKTIISILTHCLRISRLAIC